MLLTALAFVVALGVLIAIHEYGHYRVAVACGVRVERFSIGFGKPLWTWKPKKQHPGQETEFVLSAIPLGGYVKMLGQGGDPVSPELRSVAFDHKPLTSRAAIVAAGPIANLLLAIVLYACVNWIGVEEPKAILASPGLTSIAAQAGLRGREEVLSATISGQAVQELRSMEDLRWIVTQAALDGKDIELQVRDTPQSSPRSVQLPLSRMDVREADIQMLRTIGIGMPWAAPVLGELSADGAAAKAGLQQGDLVTQIDQLAIVDSFQLRELIRASVLEGAPVKSLWQVQRQGQTLQLEVTPSPVQEGKTWVGKIGGYIGGPFDTARVSYGPVDGLWRGVVRTWEVSALTVRMIGKMLIGQASLKNLSGPLTMADVAGKSASLGFVQYLVFLAVISVSLGVLNLLPLPVLDGGHLMYYAWEAVTGKPVSERWLEVLQRGGVAILLAMMCIAMFNDVSRIFG
jgi:regulator of sigma E protease